MFLKTPEKFDKIERNIYLNISLYTILYSQCVNKSKSCFLVTIFYKRVTETLRDGGANFILKRKVE